MSCAVTVPGKNGDALWALAAANSVAERFGGGSVDVFFMEGQAGLVPLAQELAFVGIADVLAGWVAIGSPHGDVPRMPPIPVAGRYVKICHLGYPAHPLWSTPPRTLVETHLAVANVPMPSAPFLRFRWMDDSADMFTIAYGFNADNGEAKERFVEQLKKEMFDFSFVDVRQMSWCAAARAIFRARCFFGDMSALHVLAVGLGKRTVIWEPDDSRRGLWARMGLLRSGDLIVQPGHHVEAMMDGVVGRPPLVEEVRMLERAAGCV
ncbi:MAG: hypothetical protein KGL39_28985 [Patescibacteria group bacterium]|nr:hypothetical protein [Patescibacteria group bacterium]